MAPNITAWGWGGGSSPAVGGGGGTGRAPQKAPRLFCRPPGGHACRRRAWAGRACAFAQYRSFGSHPSTSTCTVVWVMWKPRSMALTTLRTTCCPCSNALLRDDDVAAAGDDSGTDHPHVKVVHVEHARRRFDRGDHGGHVGSRRRALEKNRRAVAEDPVAAPEDECRDQHRHNRIRDGAARDRHDDAGDHDAERRHGIAHHVDVGAAHVDVVLWSPRAAAG